MAVVGRIVRPHGNRGDVVVESETDFGATRFTPGARLFTAHGGAIATVTVARSREQRGRWIVGLEGVDSISAAEEYRGRELRIAAEDLTPLGEDAYYLHDLTGCEVVLPSGASAGRVVRVDAPAGRPMLVVANGAGDDEMLVPLTGEICRRIDIDRKRIEIDPPDGLLEINRRT